MALPAGSPHLHTTVLDFVIQCAVGQHLGNRLPVAGDTVVLDSPRGIVTDTEIGAVGLERHGHRMFIAVPSLGQHLINKGITWQMAIDAGRLGSMGTVLPGIIVGVHGMTGDADLRVTGKVGQHLRFMD